MEQNILELSLNAYADAVDKLKAKVDTLDKSSSEYVNTLVELKRMQNEFNSALEKGGDDITNQATNVNKFTENINKLSESLGTSTTKSIAFKDVMQGVGNITQALGVNLGGVTKAIGLYNTATQMSTVMTEKFGLTAKAAWISTGIGAVILAIVGALKLLFDATQKDAQATNDMKVAFSAIQPIIDLVSNAVNVLAKWVANAAKQFAEGLPSAIQTTGKVFAAVPKWIGNVVQAFANMNKFIGKYMDGFYQTIGKTLGSAAGKFAEFADAIGLDGVANKIKSLQSSLNNLKSPFSVIGGAAENVAKTFNGYASNIEKTFNNIAANQQHYVDMSKEDIKLQQDNLKIQQENEASLGRQIDLRKQIAKEDDPKKKLELQKQLGEEITKNGKAQVEYAKRVYEQEKKRQALSPSSLADEEYLKSLERNVLKAENTYNGMLVRVEKQTAATNAKMSADTVKAAADAQKEQEKLSRSLVSGVGSSIEGVRTGAKGEVGEKQAELEILRALNKSKYETEQAYSDDIYKVKSKAVQDEIDLLQQAVDNTNILEEDKLKIINKLTSAQNELRNLQNQKQLDDIKLLHQKQKEEQEQFQKDMYDPQGEMAADWADRLSQLEPSLQEKIINTYVPENLKDEVISRLHGMNEDVFAVMRSDEEKLNEDTLAQFDLLQKQLDERKAAGEDIAEEQAELNQRIEAEANRHANAMAEIDVKETKSKQDNFKKQYDAAVKVSKQLGSVFNDIAQLEQDQIKQRYENGEISEEQAKEEFERTKKIQIAGAIMETISGALASQMSVWKDASLPLWGKIAMSALLGAQTLMSGYQQVAQIEATTFEGGGRSKTSSMATLQPASVSPLVDENRDLQQLENAQIVSQQEGDNRVYILQSDITESNKQVEIRENNTTF